MNWHKYLERHREANLDQSEIERKWKMWNLEQEEQMRIMEQMRMMEMVAQERFGLGNAGGSVIVTPEPLFKLGNSSLHFFVDDLTSIWKMFVFYYDTGEVSDLIDTGLDWNGGTITITTNQQVVQNGGFMPVFFDSTTNYWHAFFVDRDGVLVETTSSSSSPTYSVLEGLMSIYIDYSNPSAAEVKIFDGTFVKTYIIANASLVSYGGFGTGTITRDLSVPLVATVSGNNVVYIAKRDGSLIDITGTVPIPISVASSICFGSNFDHIVCLIIDGITSVYTNFRVIDSNGVIVHDEDISAYGVKDPGFFDQYGLRRFGFVGYDLGNDAVDYLVISYNSETNVLNKTTHAKGITFNGFTVFSASPTCEIPVNATYSNLVVGFFSTPPSFGTYYLSYNYYDIVWLNSESSSFQNAVVTSGTSIGIVIASNLLAKEPCFLQVDLSISPIDITANFLPTTNIGIQTISTGIDPNQVVPGVVYTNVLYDYSIVGIPTNTSPNGVVWQIYSNSSIAHQTVTSNSYDNGFPPGGGNLDTTIVYDNSSPGDSFSFAPLRQDSTPFTIGDVPTNDEVVNFMTSGAREKFNYGKQFFVDFAGTGVPRTFHLFDRIKGFFTSISNSVCDPTGAFQYWLGETTLNYICQDSSGFYNLFMYDLETGNLLHTLNTNRNAYDNYEVYGDRIFFSYHDVPGGQYDYFFVGKGGTYQVVVPDISTDYSLNDQYWA